MNSGVWLLCPYTNLYNALCMLFFDRVEFIEEKYDFYADQNKKTAPE
jgi:hypothetical protein